MAVLQGGSQECALATAASILRDGFATFIQGVGEGDEDMQVCLCIVWSTMSTHVICNFSRGWLAAIASLKDSLRYASGVQATKIINISIFKTLVCNDSDSTVSRVTAVPSRAFNRSGSSAVGTKLVVAAHTMSGK